MTTKVAPRCCSANCQIEALIGIAWSIVSACRDIHLAHWVFLRPGQYRVGWHHQARLPLGMEAICAALHVERAGIADMNSAGSRGSPFDFSDVVSEQVALRMPDNSDSADRRRPVVRLNVRLCLIDAG